MTRGVICSLANGKLPPLSCGRHQQTRVASPALQTTQNHFRPVSGSTKPGERTAPPGSDLNLSRVLRINHRNGKKKQRPRVLTKTSVPKQSRHLFQIFRSSAQSPPERLVIYALAWGNGKECVLLGRSGIRAGYLWAVWPAGQMRRLTSGLSYVRRPKCSLNEKLSMIRVNSTQFHAYRNVHSLPWPVHSSRLVIRGTIAAVTLGRVGH